MFEGIRTIKPAALRGQRGLGLEGRRAFLGRCVLCMYLNVYVCRGVYMDVCVCMYVYGCIWKFTVVSSTCRLSLAPRGVRRFFTMKGGGHLPNEPVVCQ